MDRKQALQYPRQKNSSAAPGLKYSVQETIRSSTNTGNFLSFSHMFPQNLTLTQWRHVFQLGEPCTEMGNVSAFLSQVSWSRFAQMWKVFTNPFVHLLERQQLLELELQVYNLSGVAPENQLWSIEVVLEYLLEARPELGTWNTFPLGAFWSQEESKPHRGILLSSDWVMLRVHREKGTYRYLEKSGKICGVRRLECGRGLTTSSTPPVITP